jgi:hypothetical protein
VQHFREITLQIQSLPMPNGYKSVFLAHRLMTAEQGFRYTYNSGPVLKNMQCD